MKRLLFRSNLANQGFAINRDLSGFIEGIYPYIVMGDYCKLLAERGDLAKQLVFDTNEGKLSNKSLADIVLTKEKCPENFSEVTEDIG